MTNIVIATVGVFLLLLLTNTASSPMAQPTWCGCPPWVLGSLAPPSSNHARPQAIQGPWWVGIKQQHEPRAPLPTQHAHGDERIQHVGKRVKDVGVLL